MNNEYFNPNMSNITPNNDFQNYASSLNANKIKKEDILLQEDSYVENILRQNKGTVASFYMTYTDSKDWRDMIFTGVIQQAARDHIVISDPKTGKWYLLLTIYLDYIVFDEEIDYEVL